ncbi:hypothetical protein JB92DRAFT_1057237 [Gautieria morchelliformis]|nr:hypothetical protein JB92DRAFT_1057237 [Gautieria morchelliformis]
MKSVMLSLWIRGVVNCLYVVSTSDAVLSPRCSQLGRPLNIFNSVANEFDSNSPKLDHLVMTVHPSHASLMIKAYDLGHSCSRQAFWRTIWGLDQG